MMIFLSLLCFVMATIFTTDGDNDPPIIKKWTELTPPIVVDSLENAVLCNEVTNNISKSAAASSRQNN